MFFVAVNSCELAGGKEDSYCRQGCSGHISPPCLCWEAFCDAAGSQTTAPLHLGLGGDSAAVGVLEFLHYNAGVDADFHAELRLFGVGRTAVLCSSLWGSPGAWGVLIGASGLCWGVTMTRLHPEGFEHSWDSKSKRKSFSIILDSQKYHCWNIIEFGLLQSGCVVAKGDVRSVCVQVPPWMGEAA